MRWKLEPKETGLRSIGANPNRSSNLWKDDGTDSVASVIPKGGAWNTGPFKGWFFVVIEQPNIPWKNTAGEPLFATAKEAKAAAVAYIKSCEKAAKDKITQ